jgi:hypothetical protein
MIKFFRNIYERKYSFLLKLKPNNNIIEKSKKLCYSLHIGPNKYSIKSTGMSFLIRPNLLITNYHVVKKLFEANTNSKLFIKNDKRNYKDKIVHIAPEYDLAFIEVESVDKLLNKQYFCSIKKILGYPSFAFINTLEYMRLLGMPIVSFLCSLFEKISKTRCPEIIKHINNTNLLKKEVCSVGNTIFAIRNISNNTNIRYGTVMFEQRTKLNRETSSTYRLIFEDDIENPKILCCDLYCTSGFSGSPLMDYSGEILGICFCANKFCGVTFVIGKETIERALQDYETKKQK